MPLRKGQLALHDNPNWKGGRSIASNGYVLVKAIGHPGADVRGYIYEHRLVAEQMLGRPLRRGEQVHHRNHVKSDNRPENLLVEASRHAHAVHHRHGQKRLRNPGEDNPTVECACGCGSTFRLFDGSGRARSIVSGHNLRR